MLIAGIVAGWIVLATGMAMRAMRYAEETPLVECFDCNLSSCDQCHFVERAKLDIEQNDIPIEERRLAA